MTIINRAADIAQLAHKAAGGIVHSDVMVRSADATAYLARKDLREARARHVRNVKWIVMAVTLGIYYLVPWSMRLGTAAAFPDQAILLDFANQRVRPSRSGRRNSTTWRADSSFRCGLFLVAVVRLYVPANRVDRDRRRRFSASQDDRPHAARQPWTFEKIWKKTTTHLSWLMAHRRRARLHFRDAPTLAAETIDGAAPTCAYVFLGFFTVTTYLLGGLAASRSASTCARGRASRVRWTTVTALISYREFRRSRAPPTRRASWPRRLHRARPASRSPHGHRHPRRRQLESSSARSASTPVMQRIDQARVDRLRDLPQPRRRSSRARAPARRAPHTILYAALIAPWCVRSCSAPASCST